MLEQHVAADTAIVIRNARLGLRGAPTNLRIEAGVIAAIGPDPSDSAVEVDLDGRTVLPGLWDAHVHLTHWASSRQRVDVAAATSPREAARLLADAVNGRPEQLVAGYGFRDGLWDEAPHKSHLDAAAPGRAILVLSNDLHTAWLSPAALAVVGRADHPTGVFLESEAHDVQADLPRVAASVMDGWVADSMTSAAARGVTGLLDFEIADNIADWVRRFERRQLDVRVTCAVYPPYLHDAIRLGLRTGDVVGGTRGMLTVGPVKLFVDGSLNTRTALCGDPYPGLESTPDSHGLRLTPPDELEAIMAEAAAHGLLPAVHAIGDEANRIALDAFERVGCGGRIEHAQLLRDEDVSRLARLGVVAGVQPAHVPGDRDVADRVWAGRTARSFRYADLLAAGVPLEIGSDAPVTPLDPWHGIASAVARTDDARGPWHPEQAISVDSAVAAAGRGRTTLAVGDRADLVVVDADPAEVSPDRLRSMPVSGTLLGGRWTYRRDALEERTRL